jgi:hypothetical protein
MAILGMVAIVLSTAIERFGKQLMGLFLRLKTRAV